MAKISDIINARSVDNVVPERIRAARDTTQGLTDELYTNNVIEALGGDRNLPYWIEDVKTVKKPTIPVVEEIVKVIGLDDDEGAKQGKGRTAVDKFIEDFPKFQKEWKDVVEGDKKWGERGWKTVEAVWKQAVHDKMLEDIKTERAKAVDEAESTFGPKFPGSTAISTFITRSVLPRVTERLANTGDFTAKDLALDIGENLAMSVPGAMWTGAPVKAASIVGRGMAKAGLGNTAASRVLANLPGHVTNLSNKIASSWGRNLPGTVAMGIGKTARNFAGNAVVPFAMEAADDIAYDEGEGMDERADFSAGDALTGAITNQVVNRSLARLGQGLIPEAAGSVEVRSPAVLKMRQILRSLGEPSYKSGDDFASSVRATASQQAKPTGTFTQPEINKFRSGGSMDEGIMAITPEEKAEAKLSSTVLDAIDRGDIRLRPRTAMEAKNNAFKNTDVLKSRYSTKVANNEAKAAGVEIEKLDDAINTASNELTDAYNRMGKLSAAFENGQIGQKEYNKQLTGLVQKSNDLTRTMQASIDKRHGLAQTRLDKLNEAERTSSMARDNKPASPVTEYFDADDISRRLSKYNDGYVKGTPYTMDEILGELGKHPAEYVNYANWHGKPSVEPSRMQKILGLTDNPTATEVLLNDAKVAVPTWAVNKAGRADMTKNLLKRIDATDTVKQEIEETHAAPGQRVRSASAKKILKSGGDLSDDSRKYLAYLAEHPDAVKTGHSDPKERDRFNLWLLTEGRDILEGTPLHRPVWEVK